MQYRRLLESSSGTRRSSVPVIPIHYTVSRKQLLPSSSEMVETYSAPPEDFIGRSLPANLQEFFKVSAFHSMFLFSLFLYWIGSSWLRNLLFA